MKKIYIVIIYLFLIQGLNAQQYPLFTNYIVNGFGFNPAIAGTTPCPEVKASHRQQWTGVSENPRTSLMSVQGKFKKAPIGLGGYFFADNAGALKRAGGSAALSYVLKMDSSTFLSIGAAGGYYSLQLSGNARVSDPNDPTFVNGQGGQMFPDFNAGVYFRHKGVWLGFSTPQIMERKINFSNPNAKTPNELKRHYYLMAGYEISVGKRMTIEPSGMARYVENAPFSFDASLKATFNRAFWLAANYRHGDAVAAVVGFQAKSGINLYYVYDLTTSALSAKSTGTHEFGIGMTICKKKDRDGDGVPDDEDKCPDKPGKKENKGCPDDEDKDKDKDKDKEDTDKDGVPDKEDQCPNVPGPKENKGCPFADRDNDGIRDDIDKCPDIAGTLANEGCPLKDRDKDGIVDEKDPCPDEYGEITNFGCPIGKLPPDFDPNKFAANGGIPGEYSGGNAANRRFPNAKPGDRDGDGVPDAKDPCPNTPGTNGAGCPEIPIEARNAIDFAIRNVYFDTDKAEIKAESYDYLNRLLSWMTDHPEYNLDMQGHTDNRHTEEYNLILSKNRVNNVKSYLISKGIESFRIKVEWFGETRPVASGENEAAWRKNRRVEMQWRFD